MRVGKRRRYRVFDITGKDYFFTAQQAGYSERQIGDIIQSIEAEWSDVLDKVCLDLPEQFPAYLADSLRTAFEARIPKLLNYS